MQEADVQGARYPKDSTRQPKNEPPWIPVDPVHLRYLVHMIEERNRPDRAATLLRSLYEQGVDDIRTGLYVDLPELDAPEPTTNFTLYRLTGDDGRTLYVGVTRNFEARMRVHRRNWGTLFSAVIVECYPDAETMFEAEAMAIHDENPPLNRAGVG